MLKGAGWKHCSRLTFGVTAPSAIQGPSRTQNQAATVWEPSWSGSEQQPAHRFSLGCCPWCRAQAYRRGHPGGSSSAGHRQHQGAAGDVQGWYFHQTQVPPKASFQIKVHSLTGKQPSQRQGRAASSAEHGFILSADLVPANLTIRLSMPQLSMPSDRNLWVRLYPEASGASVPRWHGNSPGKTWAVSFVCLAGVVMARAIPPLASASTSSPAPSVVYFLQGASSPQEFLGLLGQSCESRAPGCARAACPSISLKHPDSCSNNWKSHWHFCRQGGDISQFGFVLLAQQGKNSYFHVADQPICPGSSSRLSHLAGVG